MQQWILINGIVKPGHQVASGRAVNSPYPQGTIAMQTPFFRALGLDLAAYFPGTLNLSIHPYKFMLLQPDYTFPWVQWSPEHAPETFSFVHCRLHRPEQVYESLIYYPHPETKLGHFQDPFTLEVLAPPMPDISYGTSLQLELNPRSIQVQL